MDGAEQRTQNRVRAWPIPRRGGAAGFKVHGA